MTSAANASAMEAKDPAAPQKSIFQRIDARWYSSTLLTTFLVLGQWRFQILGDSYVPWACALGTAALTELVLGRLVARKWVNLLSAYISGNSVAILLKPAGNLLWPFVLCSFLSIASKYVLAWRGKHLWNPTNLGICVMLAAASSVVSILSHQWGNELWTVGVLWVLGGLTVIRAKVWHVTLTWFAAFVAFAAFRASVIDGGHFLSELAPITGPMYTMFMFFMVTDPRTIVRGRSLQIAIAVTIAGAECLIRLLAEWDVIRSDNPLAIAPPMFALFFVGPLAIVLQTWLNPPREQAR